MLNLAYLISNTGVVCVGKNEPKYQDPGWAIEFSTLVTALSEWLSEAGLSRMKPSTKVPGGLSIGGDCGAWANLRLPGRRWRPVTFSIQANSEGESRGRALSMAADR